MGNTKRQRGLKNRINVNNSTLEQSEIDEMDVDREAAKSRIDSPNVIHNPGGQMMLKDFDAQAKTFLESLEMAYEEQQRAIKMQYKKLKMKIPSELLELTLEDYVKLRDCENLNTTKVIASKSSEEQVVLTSNTSNIARISTETHKLGETFTKTMDTTISKRVSTNEVERQVVLRNSIPSYHQNPKVVVAKFEPGKAPNPIRWPKENEIAMSMKGSPMLMPNYGRVPMINLNIPLRNGQVMAILPKPMTMINCCPELSEEVLRQLDTIEKNISIVKQMCNRAAGSQTPKSLTSGSSISTPLTREMLATKSTQGMA